MQNIPNIITSVRLIAAIILAVITVLSPAHAVNYFLSLFTAAALSDMLDGFIARRFHWCTDFGAKLDSISDLALYFSVGLFLTINASTALSACSSFMLLGLAVQIVHLAFSYQKFRKFPAYHTDYTRLCAYLIFFGVVSFWLTRAAQILPALALLWTSCSLEGMLITFLLKESASDLKGIHEVLSMRKLISLEAANSR